ncbi:UvrD-helicase domain-containing protein [Kitasatospora sp. NPDC058063]|uniref:UvrD-helicase domain-containing protein n=1 Tax=unclassified Kitasatospora TaxID=2633591 RepID=UPI0036D7CE9F
MTGTSTAPTGAQLRVIDRPADRKSLVTAGAGTGKTFTLVRRIEHLVAEGLGSSELLVLTFSRAASVELRERLRLLGGRSRHVRVATFDAWALQLLREAAGDEAWIGRTFDERVRTATTLIENEQTAPESLEDIVHVLVDEVQDLVGDRRRLVQAFLEAYECGFTVVGDAAQAIYGFQVTDPTERAAETGRFFSWLRIRFAGELAEFTLDENFRVASAEAGCARSYETRLRVAGTSAEAHAIHDELRLELAALLDLDPQVSYMRRLLDDGTVRTAVLCATSGDALLVSRWFADLEIEHVVRRSAGEHAAPAWIAGIVPHLDGATAVTEGKFDRAWNALPGAAEPDAGKRAWQLLLHTAGDRSRRSVDLGRLRQAVVRGDLPDTLTVQDPQALVVSTFHRAKGLEFDRVLIIDPGPLDDRPDQVDADRCDAARALYVAMTRAREEIYRLVPPDEYVTRPRGFAAVRKVPGTERWGRYGYKAHQCLGLSALVGDVHREHPAGLEHLAFDPPGTQDYLARRVAPGDEVLWSRLDDVPVDHESRTAPGYALLHDDRPIGVASQTFRRDLYRYMQKWPRHQPPSWPRTIHGMRIDLVETVAGEDTAAARAGLPPLGLWLAPRPIGIGRFEYDRKDKDA